MDRFDALTGALRQICPTLELREEEPLSRHTSFRVGGPARLMALPNSEREARIAVNTANRYEVPHFFLGNGTNLLVADAGWRGFVIKTGGMDRLEPAGETGLAAGGGVPLSRLAMAAAERGLTGLEFAHGIPGTVGGGVTMNAGAYGGELAQVVKFTSFLNADGTVGFLQGEEHQFGYRHSAFSDGKRLILCTRFALQPGDRAQIKADMAELDRRRREKQPLDLPSAGSTFRRPEGHYAAALIEGCGLKGRRVGGAQVSEKHAGFLVNRGGATCADLLALVELVRETVFRETGVSLELEIRTLGLDESIGPIR